MKKQAMYVAGAIARWVTRVPTHAVSTKVIKQSKPWHHNSPQQQLKRLRVESEIRAIFGTNEIHLSAGDMSYGM